MKTWSAPEVHEMDVRLTAKIPCTAERSVEGGFCQPISTYNATTHEEVDGLIKPINPSNCPGS